jgi:UDP-glucose 4-epimerase
MTELSFYRGKQVLVTGGAGFIGSHLVERLVSAEANVRVADNLAQGRMDNLGSVLSNIDFRKVDVTDTKALPDILAGNEIVFHLAANASVPRSVEDPHFDFSSNCVGTLNLLDALRKKGVQRCVLASSGAVYGQPTQFPIRETDPLQPISPYGASKMGAEALCRAFHASYGLPVVIARIFNCFGPRQPRFVMYDFYRKLKRDPSRLEILGNGSQIRDFCFVGDTVDALLRLGQAGGGTAEAFNISSGSSYSVVQIARQLSEIMGLPGVKLDFTNQSWAGDAQRWEVSIEKLRAATGFTPYASLKSGLKTFVQWFDEHPDRWA